MGINWKRKLFHVLSALLLCLLAGYLSETTLRLTLLVLLFSVILFEVLRLRFPALLPFRSAWEPLLREKEKSTVSDALWFVLGLFLASLIAPLKYLQTIILILGISDPLAELVGRRWGRIRVKGRKTLEGALGFAFSAFLMSIFLLSFKPWEVLIFFVIPLTLVELFTLRDNLWIPVVGALILRIL